MTGLATDLWTSVILRFLDTDDLVEVAQMCRYARALASPDLVWLPRLLSIYVEFCSCRRRESKEGTHLLPPPVEPCRSRQCAGTAGPQLERLRKQLSRHPSFADWHEFENNNKAVCAPPSPLQGTHNKLIPYKTLLLRWTKSRDVADPFRRLLYTSDGRNEGDRPFFVVRGVGAPFKSVGTLFDWTSTSDNALVEMPTHLMQQSLFPPHKRVLLRRDGNVSAQLRLVWLFIMFRHEQRFAMALMDDPDTRCYLPLVGATMFGVCAMLTLAIAWCTASSREFSVLVSLVPLLAWVVALNCVMLRPAFWRTFPFAWIGAVLVDALAAQAVTIGCRIDFATTWSFIQVLSVFWVGLVVVLACVASETKKYDQQHVRCPYQCSILGSLLVTAVIIAPFAVSAVLVSLSLDRGNDWSWMAMTSPLFLYELGALVVFLLMHAKRFAPFPRYSEHVITMDMRHVAVQFAGLLSCIVGHVIVCLQLDSATSEPLWTTIMVTGMVNCFWSIMLGISLAFGNRSQFHGRYQDAYVATSAPRPNVYFVY